MIVRKIGRREVRKIEDGMKKDVIIDWDGFLSDRREALLSLDRDKVLAYAEKYGVSIIREVADDEYLFWIIVHKARTGALDLPDEERERSRQWLLERNLQPLG